MDGAGSEHSNGEVASTNDQDLTLLNLLVVLVRRRRVIVGAVVAFAFMGLIYSIVAPVTYTAQESVIPEAPTEGTGGFPGGVSALQGLGINLGSASSGLSVDSYPVILHSREVRLSAVRDTFYFPDENRRMTFVEYANLDPGFLERVSLLFNNYVLGLPGKLVGLVRGTAMDGPEDTKRPPNPDDYPTKEEEKAVRMFGETIGSSKNPETGILYIRATAPDPILATKLVDALVDRFSERVQKLRTEKARQNLEFIESKFQNAEGELREAEERLAEFEDRNQGRSSASLRTRRQQLQRQVDFASQLYSDLRKQLTQARIERQKSEPVITVVEDAVPPQFRSAPNRKQIVILMTLLGGILGVGLALVGAYLDAKRDQERARQRLEELETTLVDPVRETWNATTRRFRSSRPTDAETSDGETTN